MVSHGGVCVAHRSKEAFYIPGSQRDKWTPDGVKVPVNMTESEEDLKKLIVQHLIQKKQALPGNPDSRSSVEEREDTMVTQGGVCEATRPTEALDIPGSQLDVWTDDGMIIAVNFTKSEEYLKNLFVQDLLRKLQALPGNPAQITPDTTLVFEGKKLDSNSKPLGEYGIKSKSSIQIVMKVHGGVCEATRPTEALDIPGSQLDVWTDDGMKIAVNFTESEEYLKNLFVQDLLRKLQALPGNPAQITPDTTLVFEGKKLDSNSKPLGEYGIKSKSSIQIVMKVHGG